MLGGRAQEGAPGTGAEVPCPPAITLRPSGGSSAPSDRRAAVRPTLALEAPHRLLLGDAPGRDSAWLRIDGGRFAGTEIHLSLAGPHVEVFVLTPHEASRQTLAIAMEAVRNRLRTRGLTMVEAANSPARDLREPWRQGAAGEARRPADDEGGDHAIGW